MKILLALLLTANVLCGAAVDFRSGKILCAEISSKRPPISNWDAAIYSKNPLPASPVYASLTFLPANSNRRISIHDYGIDIYGRIYPCIAVRKGKGAFSADWKKIDEFMDPNSTYTLLFIINPREIEMEKKSSVTLSLKARFDSRPEIQQQVEFKLLGDRNFTQPGSIPRTGMMTVKK